MPQESNPENINPVLTVALTTRNRYEYLLKCLKSLSYLGDIPYELIIVDDNSDYLIESSLREDLKHDSIIKDFRLIRHDINKGIPYSRNELISFSRAPFVLILDDDAQLFSDSNISEALNILKADPEVGAVALELVSRDKRSLFRFPPKPEVNSYIPSFTGAGCIVRKEEFIKLGGFREIFFRYSEEQEYCKRMLNDNYHVVYIPRVRIIHDSAAVTRSSFMYDNYRLRNACYDAMLNEPFLMLIFSLPLRILGYLNSIRNIKIVSWVIRDLFSNSGSLLKNRSPLRWKTYYRWHVILKRYPSYNIGSR